MWNYNWLWRPDLLAVVCFSTGRANESLEALGRLSWHDGGMEGI